MALLPSVLLLQGPHLTQPLTHSSRWISETSILLTQTLPKAKVKARVNQLTKVKARAKKDKAKDEANLKAKKNVHPPLLLPYMPQQPKGKASHPHGPACHSGRSRLSTHFPPSLPSHLYTQPSVIPTSKARLVIVAGPASFLLRHRTRLATVAGLTLPPASPFIPPSSLYLPPIPITPARLVIVAGLA